MFRVRVTFIVLAFTISRVTAKNAKISNKVILGTTQDFMMSLKDDGQHDNKTKLLISSIVDSSRHLNHTYTVIHFETGLGPSADLEAKSFIRLVTEVDPNARILLTIRISHPNNLSTESITGRNYSNILKVFNQTTIKLEGISIELTTMKKFCGGKLADMKTLPGKIKSSLKEFKRFSNARIGYVLTDKRINCTFHNNNIRTADFIILKVPLQRNDNIFVESYGAFKVNIENLITSAENVLKQHNKTSIYYQLTIEAEVTVTENAYTLAPDGEKIFVNYTVEEKLNSLKNGLDDLQIGGAYQHLLTQYLNRWILHDQAGINAIISYQYGLKTTDPPYWDHVTVIPYFMMLPLRSSCRPLRLPESAGFLLQSVRDSRFNTIMINGDKWQELSNDRDEYIKPCPQPRCRPENVMYFNNENDALANYTTSEIKKLANIGEMKVTTLVFSPFYNESKNRPWSNIMETVKEERKLIKNRERTCTELTDFFQNIRAFNLCDSTCQALNLRKLKGCGSLEISSENIMWRGVLHIEEYSMSYFQENIMNKLDSLVIARQLIRKKYDSTNLPVFLRIVFNHTEKPSPSDSKFPVYCNPFYDQVYQYYEIILTWAKIHAFPIIIDPTANEYGFINPISWNPLITSRSWTIKELMKSSPLFIRRSYNLSTVFGTEWTNGMYPCLQNAENVGSLNNLNLNHDFAGVTINFDLRTSEVSLTSDELKLMLLFSLGKFDAVEIILVTENHTQTLLDVLSQRHFERVLKQNSIYNRKLYLQVPSLQDEPIPEILLKLQQNGFKVHVNITNVKCRHNVQRNDNLFYGTVQENCTDLAYKLVYDRNDSSLKILSANISYLVCDTFPTLATNQKKDIMHQYLETHLYMRMLFQHFYPNIKEVRFRLHPLTSDKTNNSNKIDVLNETLFLADVNNFAQGHQVHYFMLPVLPRENTTEFKESSFWTVKSYEDLSSLSIYQEKLSSVLNVTAWTPIPIWDPPTTPPFTYPNGSIGPPNYQRVEPSTIIIYISVGAASIASFVVTLLVIMKARRSNNFLSEKEEKDFFYGKMETLEKAVNERKLSNSVKKSRNVYDGLVYQKDCEISKNDINVDRKASICTTSKFSTKFRAKLQNGREGDVLVEVSSKKCTRDKFKAWMSEVKMLCYVGSHNNIVGFMGSYTSEIRNGVLWVVTEFCEEGSLENHLKTFKDTLNVEELIRFACEIAIGMEYISSQNIIHGDLRTKHVYLDQHKVCKVGDFGLSRKLLQYKAVVKKGKRERLPWRWMPCEALQHLEFSVYSDVWSYGVTVWEIFSLGELPYGEDEIFSQTFVALVMKGKRLICPSQATPEIFERMQECWTLDPEMRSEFKELVTAFSGMLTSKADV